MAESLYDRLGGVYAISGAVDILVDRLFENANVKANPVVNTHHSDPANIPGYRFLVTAWSIQAAGGPQCYPGLDMVKAHDGMKLNDHDFDAVATEIVATLNYCGVPDAETKEFMEIIESFRGEVVQA